MTHADDLDTPNEDEEFDDEFEDAGEDDEDEFDLDDEFEDDDDDEEYDFDDDEDDDDLDDREDELVLPAVATAPGSVANSAVTTDLPCRADHASPARVRRTSAGAPSASR